LPSFSVDSEARVSEETNLSTEVNSSPMSATPVPSRFDGVQPPGIRGDLDRVHDLEHRNRDVRHRVSLVDDQSQRDPMAVSLVQVAAGLQLFCSRGPLAR
jgi:hypothetical protein